MKEVKKYLLMFFAAATVLALATACSSSDDDDEDENLTLAEAIEGEYEATYTTEEFGEGEMEVLITRTADQQVTITLGEMEFPELVSFTLPVITAVPLTGKASSVGMVKNESGISVTGTADQTGNDVTFRASYDMIGTVKSKTDLRLEFIFTPELDILEEYSPITIVVTGTKIEEDDEDEE